MAYKIAVIPDETMPIWTEQSLDDRFKPEATWATSFLKGNREKEILGDDGRELKNGILKITHQASELLTDIGHLTEIQKEKLQSIHETAKNLLKTGEKLREKIDLETDK